MSQDAARHDLRRLDLADDLRTPETKRRYVRTLFDTVQSSYDGFTRWFSFGMDARWKRLLVAEVCERVREGGLVLDLATGTGDLAVAIRHRRPDLTIVGADLSMGMLKRARGQIGSSPNDAQADMVHLPYAADQFDGVVAGYCFRNAPDFTAAVTEAHRVLRPGGCLGTLDFYLPTSAVWRFLFVAYLRHAGRLAGMLTHGVADAYGYIAESLERWRTAESFSRLLRERGLALELVRSLLFGGIAVHVATKSLS